jgi:hypothetical protein
MVRVVGKAGDTLFADKVDPEREPIAPQLVYGSPGVEELRYLASMLGRRELARRTGMPDSRYRGFVEGSNTSNETLSLVAKAVEIESTARRCAYSGCERSARPRSKTCSETCRKALALGRIGSHMSFRNAEPLSSQRALQGAWLDPTSAWYLSCAVLTGSYVIGLGVTYLRLPAPNATSSSPLKTRLDATRRSSGRSADSSRLYSRAHN